MIEPLLPTLACAAKAGGRPEKHLRREIVDAIRSVVDTGCTWRALRPWSVVLAGSGESFMPRPQRGEVVAGEGPRDEVEVAADVQVEVLREAWVVRIGEQVLPAVQAPGEQQRLQVLGVAEAEAYDSAGGVDGVPDLGVPGHVEDDAVLGPEPGDRAVPRVNVAVEAVEDEFGELALHVDLRHIDLGDVGNQSAVSTLRRRPVRFGYRAGDRAHAGVHQMVEPELTAEGGVLGRPPVAAQDAVPVEIADHGRGEGQPSGLLHHLKRVLGPGEPGGKGAFLRVVHRDGLVFAEAGEHGHKPVLEPGHVHSPHQALAPCRGRNCPHPRERCACKVRRAFSGTADAAVGVPGAIPVRILTWVEPQLRIGIRHIPTPRRRRSSAAPHPLCGPADLSCGSAPGGRGNAGSGSVRMTPTENERKPGRRGAFSAN
ncbi:hypothetical protein B7C62_15270 [Kitasatospora albolonga]|uniref:Insertion element IS402-like domain-containing protein n=1 Tax=Kitasatospora albolonga TaxID=68173 RepID=A0ABC8C435_9ACTN|nr:hypothetical protein B7C62_15270 [Kitasatospora albolonga]